MGTAASFVLFSSTGAVGNTGATSHFTGDIGTVSGAITIGVNVNGVIHNADAVASAAAASVLGAYQQLQLTPPTDTQFAATSYTLGTGDTLRAGVDSITVNTLLDSTLILDGQNNANAVFIFKIHGIFSSTSTAAIVLINGALACNVFWQVNGAVSMVSGTKIRGTIIANSAAINLGAGVTLEGRALTSTAGAITATSVLTYLPTGCGSPVLTGPLAPVLGVTACYALFTTNGANTNSGITNVTGDVGTNVGLTTGYNALLVNGTIHPVPDVSTAACAFDLGIVNTYLAALVPDIELLYPALLGNNLVLTPHTYIMNAAAALTDTLYLNAEGNPNAVFVIQINGALSTSTFATIVLTNGTQAKNVFWKVNGAISISNNSVIKGTFVANNGAVDLGTGVNLDGRALSTTGAFSTDAVTAVIPLNTCSIVPLPVRWLYFRGKAVAESVSLTWGTTDEMNNGLFTIEKSRDAVQFETLATVKAGVEKGTGEIHYSFTDEQPYPTSYYRISQRDNDGQQRYYRTIEVSANLFRTQNAAVYVQGSYIYVTYVDAVPGNGSLVLYSIDGRKLSSQAIMLTKEVSSYKIEKPMQTGMYLVYIESGGARRFSGKVVVN